MIPTASKNADGLEGASDDESKHVTKSRLERSLRPGPNEAACR